VYGGPVASDTEATAALDLAALDLARSLGVDHLEYRLLQPMHDDWSRDSETYATFRKDLDPDPERNMLAVPRKQRAMIRKGIKNQLTAERDDSVERFFPIYAESVRNLGTPVLPKAYFRGLVETFGDACEVTTVSDQGAPVSGVISFFFRDQVLPYYGGGVPTARALAAFDFMYWQVMRDACERGYRVYDFGRSKSGTGSFDFKTHWGFQPEPLHYEYHLLSGGERPSINPLNPKYRLMIATWKRLPMPLANLIGPLIARQIG
jgi:FemAB-related protein (PEP-CTERM system-associated)